MFNTNEFFFKLWKACNQLRGRFDTAEYKYIILTIIFLKFASDTYSTKINELNFKKLSFLEIKKELMKEKIIILPTGYQWNDLLNCIGHGNIHNFIDAMLEQIEIMNSVRVKKLWKYFSEKFDKDVHRLEKIINIFQNENFQENICQNTDVLGRTYEYFLKQFGENSGKKSGEFYTPKTIVECMVELLISQNKKDCDKLEIYDPTVGSGGMFIQSAQLLKNKNSTIFYGQEINSNIYTLAQMNLAIRGLNFDLGPEPEDTLIHDHFPNKKFDIVIANPPFNLQIIKEDIINANDNKWLYGVPTDSKANYFFIQHMIDKMNEKGIMAVLLDNGSQSSKSSEKIRENILKANLYEVVIELPENIFYGTSISATLFILNKNKHLNNKDKVLFIDSKMNFTKNGIINELDRINIDKILNIYKKFQMGNEIDIPNFAKSVSLKNIEKNYFSLSPRQYILKEVEIKNYKEEYKSAIYEFKQHIKNINNDFNNLLKHLDEFDEN